MLAPWKLLICTVIINANVKSVAPSGEWLNSSKKRIKFSSVQFNTCIFISD